MSDKGRKPDHKLVLWVSLVEALDCTRIHLLEDRKWKSQNFERPKVVGCSADSNLESSPEGMEPPTMEEQNSAPGETRELTKLQLLSKHRSLTQRIVWTVQEFLQKDLQCLNQKDEVVDQLPLSQFKQRAGQVLHLVTSEAQYWAVDTPNNFLLLAVPRDSECDFTAEVIEICNLLQGRIKDVDVLKFNLRIYCFPRLIKAEEERLKQAEAEAKAQTMETINSEAQQSGPEDPRQIPVELTLQGGPGAPQLQERKEAQVSTEKLLKPGSIQSPIQDLLQEQPQITKALIKDGFQQGEVNIIEEQDGILVSHNTSMHQDADMSASFIDVENSRLIEDQVKSWNKVLRPRKPKPAEREAEIVSDSDVTPNEFNFMEWVRELRQHSRNGIQLLLKFDELYHRLKDNGPWFEVERPKGKNKDEEPQVKTILKITYNPKLLKIMQEALKFKKTDENNKTEWKPIDYQEHFDTLKLEEIDKIFFVDDKVVKLFLGNRGAKASLIYHVCPFSIAKNIVLKQSKDESVPIVSYSSILTNYLDYLLTTNEDFFMILEVLIYGINHKNNHQMTKQEKLKLVLLMIDCIGQFSCLFSTKVSENQKMILEIFEILKSAIGKHPSILIKIGDQVFGQKDAQQRQEFFMKVVVDEPKCFDFEIYDLIFKDQGITQDQKLKIMQSCIEDKAICHNNHFLRLIEASDHLELLCTALENYILKENTDHKKIHQEEDFLRYCLKAIVGGSRNIIFERVIIWLHQNVIQGNKNRFQKNVCAFMEQQKTLIYECYTTISRYAAVLLPADQVKIDMIIDHTGSLSNYASLICEIYSEFLSNFITKREDVVKIQDDFRDERSVLENHTAFLKDKRFFKETLSHLNQLESSLMTLTISEVRHQHQLRNLGVLHADCWERIYPFLRLPATRRELEKLADSSSSIVEFTQNLETYIQLTRRKFVTLADPACYSFQDSLTYFKQVNKLTPEGYSHIETQLTQMRIDRSVVDSILENSLCFAALRKTIKLTEAAITIKDMKFLNLEDSDLVKKMDSLKEKFAGRDPKTLFLSQVLEADNASRIVSRKLIRTLPDCLIHIAKCPDALKFIQGKEDQLIRSMRDDCGSEDTDIVIKLEAINRSLKPITKEAASIEDVLVHVHQLEKKYRDEISDWIDEVDKSFKHLEYVFQKAQKGTQFHKNQVLGIMSESMLLIKYNPKFMVFEASAKFGETKEIVGAEEFLELFNLIKILVSDSATRPDDVPDNDHNKMLDFSKLGDLVKTLLTHVEWMKSCGLISTAFTASVRHKMETSSRSKISFSTDNLVMQINFTHGDDSIDMIRNLVENLSKVQKTVNASLTNDVMYWSLFNNYSGSKLFYLTELLNGNNRNVADTIQVLNVITESLSLPESDLDMLRRPCNFFKISSEVENQIDSVHNAMRKFSEKVFSDIDLKNDYPAMLPKCRDVIKVCPTKFTLKSKDPLQPPRLVELNEFETIFKLLHHANQPMVSLSQVFYCGAQLNLFDLVAFLQRALRDPLHRFYFVLNADAMAADIFEDFVDHAKAIVGHRAANRSLLVFLDDARRRAKLESVGCFVDCRESLADILDLVSRGEIAERFGEALGRSQIVHSTAAGMGKSRYIAEDSAGKSLVDLFLAGEVNEATVMHRLTGAIEQCRGSTDLAVCIKLDYIEAYQEHARLIDFVLFCLCVLRKVPTEKGCHIFGNQLHRIYIELGNTSVKTLLETSAILKILCWEECKQIGDFKIIHHIPEFDVSRIEYVNNPESEEQRAMKVLRIINEGLRDYLIEDLPIVNKAKFEQYIKEYFLRLYCKKDPKLVTYAQYKFWLKNLAMIGTDMDAISELRPDSLASFEKELRVEILTEEAYLASHLSNFTVEQVRSTQAEMKALVSSIQNHETDFADVKRYKERFAKLEPWNCKHFVLPMMNPKKQKFMLALYDVEMLKNDEDAFRRNQRRVTKKLVEQRGWYSENADGKKLERHFIYARMMAEYLGEDPNSLTKRVEGYTITGDNFMKAFLMVKKAKIKVPIIIMGESGCGKTFLTEFVAKTLLDQPFKLITLYSGLPEADLLDFVDKCIEEAKEIRDQGKDLWVFFDEFNTSSLQSVVCEIMIDRKFSVGCPEIRIIPDNIVFVAACNPYRLKMKNSDFALVPKQVDSILSHRVYPIPERIINFVWDFGQLSSEDERRYINRMIKNASIFKVKEENTINEENNEDEFIVIKDEKSKQNFSDAVFEIHTHVRLAEEKSGVSLRDIKRVIQLFEWFYRKLYYISKSDRFPTELRKELTSSKMVVKSMILSIMMAYGLRLNGRSDVQNQLLNKLVPYVKKFSLLSIRKCDPQDINKEISDFVDKYCFNELQKIPGIIPDDIAPNKPLKENFLAMLIAFDTHIPLIICGAPGTSKTLCTQILVAALNPENRSAYNMPFFEKFKTMYTLYYGGSETSTSEGISKVFHRAEQYLKKSSDDTPTIIFDEIGLAELSPHNPLKVLHPLLEKRDSQISFIGMSNWTLDMSKMNRLIFVSRPELTLDDLKSIFKTITAKLRLEDSHKDLETSLEVLAETYIRYIEWQKKHGTHRHFHGSRDMYAVSKFILHRAQSEARLEPHKIQELIKLAIERNFNGAIYAFEGQPSTSSVTGKISMSSVPGLADERLQDQLRNLRPSDLDTLQTIDRLCSGEAITKTDVHLTSASVFKRFYLDELRKRKLAHAVSAETFLVDYNTVELVEQNIREHSCRFLMLRSEGDLVDAIILARLKKIYHEDNHYKNKIIDWRGVENQGNQIELLSTLKSYINLGYIVVMKNLDALYGSLYDLFNQKYMRMGDQQMCFLYYGESKQKVQVHPKFKCIVIQDNLTEESQDVIERKQPAPFLNRFEKFFVRISSLLDLDHIKSLIALRMSSLKLTGHCNDTIVGLSIDLITSICLELEHLVHASGVDDFEIFDLKQIGEIKVPREQIVKFLQVCTTDILIKNDQFSENQKDLIKRAHKVNSLEALLKDSQNETQCRKCIFTFSYPDVFDTLKAQSDLAKYFTSYSIADGKDVEDLYRMSIQKRLNHIRSLRGNWLIVIRQADHVEVLPQIKSAVNDNRELGRLVVLVHFERDLKKGVFFGSQGGSSGIDFWNGWDNLLIDDLEGTNYSDICSLMDLSLSELVSVGKKQSPLELQIGHQMFMTAVISVLQSLTLDNADLDFKQNIRQIEKIFRHEDYRYILTILKRSLPDTGDELHKKSCHDLLNGSVSKPHYCRDIVKDLTVKFKQVADNPIRQSLISLDNHLATLASYARVITDQSLDPKLRNKFSDELRDALTKWDSQSPPRQSQTSLQVPFLRDRYQPIVERLQEIVRDEDFQERLKQLIADEYNAYLDQSRSTLDELGHRITKGQNMLLHKINEASKEVETIMQQMSDYQIDTSRAELRSMLLYDILKLCFYDAEQQKPQFLSSFSMYEKLERLLIHLSNISQTADFGRLLEVGVFMITRSKLNHDELDVVASTIDITDSTLSELELHKNDEDHYNSPVKIQLLIHLINDIELESSNSLTSQPLLSNGMPHQSRSIVADYLTFSLMMQAPFGDTFLANVQRVKDAAKQQRRRLGKKVYVQEIKLGLAKIMHTIKLSGTQNDLHNEERNRGVSYLCRYFYATASEYSLEFFLSSSADPLFESLGVHETENICNGIVRAIFDRHEDEILRCLLIGSKLADLLAGDAIQKSNLARLANMLAKMSTIEKPRIQTVLCILIDRLTVVNQSREETWAHNYNGLELLELAEKHLDFSHSLIDLKNILCIVVIRSALSKPFFGYLEFYPHYRYKNKLNSIIGRCPPPTELLERPDRYLVIYFIQGLILNTQGDISQWDTFSAVFGFTEHVRTSSNKKIVIMDEHGITFYNKLSSAVSQDIIESNCLRVANLMQSEEANGLGIDYAQYILACDFINRFINTESEEERNHIQTLNRFALEMISKMQFDDLFKRMLRTIVEGTAFNFTRFMQEGEDDREFSELLKKLFYQHYALVVCFRGKLGYDLNAYDRPTNTISTAGFKAHVRATKNFENVCGVLIQTITVRLRAIGFVPGRPLDYARSQNLGMYRCSCGYFYGLQDCGFPAVQYRCPDCRLPIGGINHQMVQRAGHIHIPTFEQLGRLMAEMYNDQDRLSYSPHRIILGSDPLLYQLKIQEYPIMDIVNNCQNEAFGRGLGVKMIYRHLFDHFFLMTQQEAISPEALEVFKAAVENTIKVDRAELRTMANRNIETTEEYFLAHIKNDIEVLRRDLGLRNSIEIFDWLRAAYSRAAIKIKNTPRGAQFPAEAVQPNLEDMNSAQGLLTKEQEFMRLQSSDETQGYKGILKMLVNKRIPMSLLEDLHSKTLEKIKEHPEHSAVVPRVSLLNLYRVLRHNYQDKNEIMYVFRQRIENIPNKLLNNIVRCDSLLRDYAKIIMANYGIAKVLARKYNRRFTIEEARKTTLASLNDPEVELHFDRFIHAWEVIIPKYNEKHPDVFDFAFMCAQNFDVNVISEMIVKSRLATPVFAFLMVDRADCEDSDTLFMKSIVATLLNKLHNRLVDEACRVLGIDPAASGNTTAIRLDHCSASSLVAPVDFTASVLKNYYFGTEADSETKLVFDLATIEADCARLLLRSKVMVDEADLPYYSFKFSKKTQRLNYVTRLKKKFSAATLSDSVQSELARLAEDEAAQALDFLLEIAEPVLLDYHYDSPDMTLAEVAMLTRASRPPRLRLEDLVVSEIGALYDFLTGLVMESELNTPLDKDQRRDIRALPISTLASLSKEIRETFNSYAGEKRQLREMQVQMMGIETDYLLDSLQSLTFGHLMEIERVLTQRKRQSTTNPFEVEMNIREDTTRRNDAEMDWESM